MSDQLPPPDDDDGADAPDGLDLGGLLGDLGGGGGGLGDLLAGAQQAMAASQAASEREVEGSSGGGMVRILATGAGEIRRVAIDPRVVDPGDVEGLEDLVLAAVRDVNARVTALHQEAMSGAMGGFDPSAVLGGLFGGEADDDEPGDDEPDELDDEPDDEME